ncbi:MAG: YraN family protein [Kiritimatiellae bacterium]|nr:YraN family protein [Kiritimatiellia bacterium]MDD5520249.1 YraN family protein [Kiritimatiellia bacterium]
MSRNDTAETGLWGEKEAERALKSKGYKILGRRVRIGDRDEIDLVARNGDVLVFVEVKTRVSDDFGRPISAVDNAKRHTMSRAAVRYLKKIKCPKVNFRFDVVEVLGSKDSGGPVVNHIENAFTLGNRYTVPC